MGFTDPMQVLARIKGFSKGDTLAPIELLRQGFKFHARGFINREVIQNNLDWVWPYWVEKQYNPRDYSFIPTSFSITNINLTQRNWTAVGKPGYQDMPIVDPRGLVTPFHDGWSLDFWVLGEKPLLPSNERGCSQSVSDGAVTTEIKRGDKWIGSITSVTEKNGKLECHIDIETDGDLAVALRPYNPEGISSIKSIKTNKKGFIVDSEKKISFDKEPERYALSSYQEGDSFYSHTAKKEVYCNAGMASGVAVFPKKVRVSVPLETKKSLFPPSGNSPAALQGLRFDSLYDSALQTVILHATAGLFAGPYTYKRFWFRDSAYVINALLCLGITDTPEAMIDFFISQQTKLGYFHSQESEWDSNGQALWAIQQYYQKTGHLPERWLKPIDKGARWITKHLESNKAKPNSKHYGLIPAGFSAEHFGPSDYYYWDDYWSVAGLKAAAEMLGNKQYSAKADKLLADVNESLRKTGLVIMPISPYRKPSSASVGCLVASYPLQLYPGRDKRIKETARFLLGRCTLNNTLFHEVSHAGMNPYLSLHLAQTLLREGTDFSRIVEGVAELASPTGKWPEAVHPFSGGGCMGDGEHVWAAAEWLLMIRNCFVFEDEKLVLGKGLYPDWFNRVSFGYTRTRYGDIKIEAKKIKDGIQLTWDANWKTQPEMVIAIPGHKKTKVTAQTMFVERIQRTHE
ncbi:MAG: hypothetical protein ACQESG_07885 [Nanobdellota archaeon]